MKKQSVPLQKTIARKPPLTHNAPMNVKISVAWVALAIVFVASASLSVARADEHPTIVPVTIILGDGQLPTDLSGSSDVSQLVPPAPAFSISPSPVPEPTTAGFLAIGTLLLGIARPRGRKQR